jgi:DNA/RNA-binding domain of Phe-tRNA-synthetase-like protein
MTGELDSLCRAGDVAAALRAEFPGLELRFAVVPVRSGPSLPAARARLKALSDLYGGARVVAMRTQAIAHAYRAFYRHVGLDPDVTRVPSEAAAVARLLEGGFHPRDRISDALLVALVETGAPVWALDADHVDAPTLSIRSAQAGECLGAGEGAVPLTAGALVIADRAAIHGVLFGLFAEAHRPTPRTRELVLVAVGVPGVPTIYLEEALWTCTEMLGVGEADPGKPADSPERRW